MTILVGAPPLFGIRRPIEFVSSSINRSGTSTNTVTAPASIAEGDLLVMAATNRNSRTITSPPSGWTEHLNDNSGTPTAQVYTKVATGSEPADYTWGWSSTGSNTIAILCYRRASAVDLVGARTRNSSTTSTVASITPTRAGALLAVFGRDKNGTVATAPAGMTQRVLQTSEDPPLAVYDLIPSPASATGDKTLVWGVTEHNVGWQIQIY